MFVIVKIVQLELKTQFAEGTVNAFLAIGETVSLIDTGNPGKESYQQLKTELHKHGVTIQDLDHIILTHTHIDHAGGIPSIQTEREIPIFVHNKARNSINMSKETFEKGQTFMNQFIKECGADADVHINERRYREEKWQNLHYIKEGDRVLLGGVEFEVVYVPGHSQYDILLWDPKTGDAFSGDHLIKAFSVNAFIEPPFSGEKKRPKPLLQYRDSFEKIRRLPLKMLYPGHGEVFSDHIEVINKRLLEQEKRCNQITEILSSGEKTIFEICQKMYPQLKGNTIFLGLSQIQGHLDLLETREKVAFEKSGSIIKYRLLNE